MIYTVHDRETEMFARTTEKRRKKEGEEKRERENERETIKPEG